MILSLLRFGRFQVLDLAPANRKQPAHGVPKLRA